MDGEYLGHLRFADGTVLISEDLNELQTMLEEVNQKSKEIGLRMNPMKTQVTPNAIADLDDTLLNGDPFEKNGLVHIPGPIDLSGLQ